MKKYAFLALIFSSILLLLIYGCGGGGSGGFRALTPQTGTITGIVTKSDLSFSLRAQAVPSAVANAKVWLQDYPSISSVTDSDGRYSISNVPVGLHYVVAHATYDAVSYKMREPVEVTANNTEERNIVTYKATNVIEGVLKDENNKYLPIGTKLYIWGEEFKILSNGSFTTPELPYLGINKSEHDILIKLDNKQPITITVAFASVKSQPYLELTLPTSSSDTQTPVVSLLAIKNGEEVAEVDANDSILIRAIVFPDFLSSEHLTWIALSGEFVDSTTSIREKTWIAPTNANKAQISLIAKLGNKTSKATLTIDVNIPKIFKVTYDGNQNTGGIPPSDSNQYESGSDITIKANTGNLTRKNHEFVCWNTDKEGYGIDYIPNSIVKMPSQDLFLFAKWDYLPTFKVKYDGNDNDSGEPPVDTQEYKSKETAIVKGNTGQLKKDGYAFSGWSIRKDLLENPFNESDEIKIGFENIILYAVWTPLYSVTYNGNDNTVGEPPVDSNFYMPEQEVKIASSNDLQKEGYNFVGWNTQPDGEGETYQPASKLLMPKQDLVLYAIWSQKPVFYITYNPNENTDGEPPIDLNAYQEDDWVTVLNIEENFKKEGYIFGGWAVYEDENEPKLSPIAIYQADEKIQMPSNDFTLYAFWIPVYKITYLVDDYTAGAVPLDENLYKEGDLFTVLKSTDLEKNKHRFVAWTTDLDNPQTLYHPDNQGYMPPNNLNLYALWEKVYRVFYHGEEHTDGVTPTDDNLYKEGELVYLKEASVGFAKKGYVFKGWHTSQNTDEQPLPFGEPLIVAQEDINLYAQWEVDPKIEWLQLVFPQPVVGNTALDVTSLQLLNDDPAFSVIDLKWNEPLTSNDKYMADTVYKAEVSLASKNNRYFTTRPFVPSIDAALSVSNTVTTGETSGNRVTFDVTWKKTDSLQLVEIQIKQQPKLIYKEHAEQTLDLSNLIITEIYNDTSTNEVSFSAPELPQNYKTVPQNGELLDIAQHQGQPVSITHTKSGLTIDTMPISITTPEEIANVVLDIPMPQTGFPSLTAQQVQELNEHYELDYTVSSLIWHDPMSESDTFLPNMAYRATLTLISKNGKLFAQNPLPPVIEGAKSITSIEVSGSEVGNHLSFRVSWEKTEPVTIKQIEILDQPTKLAYKEPIDNELSLQGLIIKEIYNDGTTKEIVFGASYTPLGYKSMPPAKTLLTHSEHAQMQIEITHIESNLSALTQNISVDLILLITELQLYISEPSLDKTPDTTEIVNLTTSSPDFEVTKVEWEGEFTPAGFFKPQHLYKTQIELTANQLKMFQPAPFVPTVKNATNVSETTTVGEEDANKLFFTITWQTTPSKQVDKISVLRAPKISYIEGESLDLSALVILETYNDLSTNEVSFANEIPAGYSTIPSHGDMLTNQNNNGQPIFIFHSPSDANIKTANLIVSAPGEIAGAFLMVTAPQIGREAQTAQDAQTATNNPDFTIESLLWNEALSEQGKFLPNAAYSATILLKSKNGKKFQQAPFTPQIEGATCGTTTTSGTVVGNKVSFIASWEKTDSLQIQSIAVTRQPNKLQYIENIDNILNLTGMIVTEHYNDLTSKEIAFGSTTPANYTTIPPNKAILNPQDHDDKPIKIIHNPSGLNDYTTQLTVSLQLFDEISSVHLVVAKPVVGELPQTAQEVQANTNSPDFTVESITINESLTEQNRFKAKTRYTFTVVLKSNDTNLFQTAPFTPTISDSSALVSQTTTQGEMVGNTVTFTITWQETAPLALKQITLTKPPEKLTYTENIDNILTLNGMEITETYNDLTSAIVLFTDTMPIGYTSSPSLGAQLTLSDNGRRVVITHTATGYEANTPELTVNLQIIEEINSLVFKMTAPATGALPQTIEAIQEQNLHPDYTVLSVTWNQPFSEENTFKAATQYTSTVILKSQNGKCFQADPFLPTVDGAELVSMTSVSGTGVGNQISFIITWPQTTAPLITSIEVTKQPTKLSYTEIEDDILDLSGMQVTENYTDHSTQLVNFTNGTAQGYQASPANSTLLNNLQHNETFIIVTHQQSGLKAQTKNLSVAAQGEIAAALVIITPPSAGAIPDNTSVVQAVTNHDYYNVKSVKWNGALSPQNRFKADTDYTVSITLESKNGKKFQTTPFTPSVPNSAGVSKTTTDGSEIGNTVAFSVFYNTTQPLTIVSISVEEDPIQTTYSINDLLDLTGLVIKETYNDLTTDLITFINGTATGYTVEPPNQTVLNLSHDNQPIRITHTLSNQTTTTQPITVLSGPIEEIKEATIVFTSPLAGQFPDTLEEVEAATNNQYFTVESILINQSLTDENRYKAETTYTLDVVLKSKNGKKFTSIPFVPFVEGAKEVSLTLTEGSQVGNKVSFTVTFNSTAILSVQSIALLTEPYTSSYLVGDQLNLSGITIKEIYNDFTFSTVTFPSGEAPGYSAEPAHGTVLSLSHNNISITITHTISGKTALTLPITVSSEVIIELSAATVIMTAPSVGEYPPLAQEVETATKDENFVVESIVWHEELTEQGRYKADQEYSCLVILKSKPGKKFQSAPFVPLVENSSSVSQTTTSGNQPENTVSFTIYWDRTQALQVASLKVITQPNKTSYAQTIDDILDLTGLKIEETYNDFSVMTVEFVNGTADGYTTNPAHGSTLNSSHDNTSIIITHNASGKTAATDPISVLPAPVELIDSAEVVITPPATGAVPNNSSDAESATNNQFFTVESLIWNEYLNDKDRFKGATQYTSTIKLKSKNGKKFSSESFTPIIQGTESVSQTTTVGNDVGNTVEFTATWPYTDSLTAERITIKTQPSKMQYIVSELLMLDGMILEVEYNDQTVDEVTFTAGTAIGFEAEPANRTQLDLSYNFRAIKITHSSSGLFVYTSPITVEEEGIPEITSAFVLMRAPVANELPQPAEEIKNNTYHADYVVEEVTWLEELDEGKFKYSQVYTTRIVLKSRNGKRFQLTPFTPNVTGSQMVSQTTVDGTEEGNKVTFTVYWSETEAPPSSNAIINKFCLELDSPAGRFCGVINQEAKEITITLPFGTQVTAAATSIEYEGISIVPPNYQAQDFSQPINYTVTAADNQTVVTYKVQVEFEPPSANKNITKFNFEETFPFVVGVIDNENNTIVHTMGEDEDVSNLLPTILHEGVSISPPKYERQNFNNPVDYTVTAQDGSTKTYTVSIRKVPLIKSFAFIDLGVYGVIDNNNNTISLTVGDEADLTSLVPTIEFSGESVEPKDGVAQDFTSSVKYTVTSSSGEQKEYIVTVSQNILPKIYITKFNLETDFSQVVEGLINEDQMQISLYIPDMSKITNLTPTIEHTAQSVEPQSGAPQDFSFGAMYVLTAAGGALKSYFVNVYSDSTNSMLLFTLQGTGWNSWGSINEDNKTITLEIEEGIDITNLIPSIMHDGFTVQPDSETPTNFEEPVTYTVTAYNGSARSYEIIIVRYDPPPRIITSFNFEVEGMSSIGEIDQENKTITLLVDKGTDKSALIPTILWEGESIEPLPGDPNDFRVPQQYTVTDTQQRTTVYTVYVNEKN